MLAIGRPGLLLARTDLLRRSGGLRRSGTPSNLLLRAALRTTVDRIIHVPVVWLSRPAAAPPGAAQVRQAQAYLTASGQPGCVVQAQAGLLRVLHPVPRDCPAVIGHRRNPEPRRASCKVHGRPADPNGLSPLEVIIVDNGSDEPAALLLLDRLARDSRVRVLFQPGPFNWAALTNTGVAAMNGVVALLLNNDTEVLQPEWLREIVSHAIRPGVGAVGAKLLYPNRTIQHAGVVLDTKGHALHMWRGRPGDDLGYLPTVLPQSGKSARLPGRAWPFGARFTTRSAAAIPMISQLPGTMWTCAFGFGRAGFG